MKESKLYGGTGVLVIVSLAIVLMLLFLKSELEHTSGQLGVPLDDAWIHYQFARNLSQGDGFSFNPGEPTPGSTAPLWTLLLAAAGLLDLPFLTFSIVLSALFFLISVLAAYALAATLSAKPWVGLVAALGVALTGRLLWASLAGMETTAFAALSLIAVWIYIKRGLNLWTAILFGLASQMRPEGHALFVMAFIDAGWRAYKLNSGESGRYAGWLTKIVIPLLAYAVISLPYSVFSLLQTGRPLPNTFYAKAGTEHLFSWRTLSETITLHWHDNPVIFILAIIGLFPTWRRSRLVAAWCLVMPLSSAFTVDFVWHHGRYTIPLIPFVMTMAALGIQWLVHRSPVRYRGMGGMLLILLMMAASASRLPDWASMLGQNSREILDIDVAIGKWLAENTESDSLIAVDDIGAIGYLSGRRIFDLNGLVSPEMWPIIRHEAQGLPRNEAATRILSEVQADYLAIFPLWHYEIVTNPFVVKPIKEFHTDSRTIIGEQDAVVYQARWPYLQGYCSTSTPIASFGQAIDLLSFDFTEPSQSIPEVRLSLIWRSEKPVTQSYDVFVHVVDADGQIIAQADNKPVFNLAPTNRWMAGDIIQDSYVINWPEQAAVATYTVKIGLYQRETGERLTVTTGQASEGAVLLTTFSWDETVIEVSH